MRAVERTDGPERLAAALVELGVLRPDELPSPGEGSLAERLVEGGQLRQDLRLAVDLEPAGGGFAYVVQPLTALALPGEVEQALAARRGRGGVLSELVAGLVLARLGASIRSVGLDVGMPGLSPGAAPAPGAAEALPRRAVELFRALPLGREGEALVVAMWDPLDFAQVADLEALVGGPVHAVLADPGALNRALVALGVTPGPERPAGDEEPPADDEDEFELELLEDPLYGVLMEAIEEGASEVLLEPRAGAASLRFRVRGELRKEREVSDDVAALLVDRLEAGQEGASGPVRTGRARWEVSGLPVLLDYRVIETPLGPAVGLELEPEEADALQGLGQLGLSLDALAAFEALLARGRGIIVLAAPPHGGKTQAYYAVLDRACRLGGAVLSLERRVRRLVPGALQVDSDPAQGPLEALLHPAPDWLGIDGHLGPATVRLAVDVALGGGTVLLTVPAPSGQAALERLQMAGIPAGLLEREVRAVLARRAVTRNCPRCRFQRQPQPSPLRRLGFDPALLEELSTWLGLGCPACADTGSAGRLALAELVRPAPGGRVVPLGGSRPLGERARELVLSGEVPLEAVADCL